MKLDPPPAPETNPAAERGKATPASLEAFITEVKRKINEEPHPEKARAAHAETADPRLAAALAAAATQPSVITYRGVAAEYRRLGIADRAHDYLASAAALEPRDGATYDAIARMWRDDGFADRALADAYRAVYFAPASAVARNTLGTVFQALGRHADARRAYERAVELDPTAVYALNNACYAWLLEGEAAKAERACQRALALDPAMAAARNNLALAYAAAGKMNAARETFAQGNDRASAQYNVGIVQMARRRYADAVTAFAAAQQIKPDWRKAAVRAQQAEKLARAGAEE